MLRAAPKKNTKNLLPLARSRSRALPAALRRNIYNIAAVLFMWTTLPAFGAASYVPRSAPTEYL